jgi:Arc/MetJ-type ribon-helix-helix transcriptional regulator
MDEVKKQIVDFFIAEGSYSSEEEVIAAALATLVEKRLREEGKARELEYELETYAMQLSDTDIMSKDAFFQDEDEEDDWF